MSVMIYYWMVNCQIAAAPIDVAGPDVSGLFSRSFSARSRRNSEGAKVTTRELQ